MEKKQKHLEMIQGIINRMSGNSFALKGWSVTLISGIFALSEKNGIKCDYLAIYIPAVLFWCLDSYYLYKERQYRALYNHVITLDDNMINFKMDIPISFNRSEYFSSFLSFTEIGFYIPLIILTSIVIFFI